MCVHCENMALRREIVRLKALFDASLSVLDEKNAALAFAETVFWDGPAPKPEEEPVDA